jgi:hypothetical protein
VHAAPASCDDHTFRSRADRFLLGLGRRPHLRVHTRRPSLPCTRTGVYSHLGLEEGYSVGGQSAPSCFSFVSSRNSLTLTRGLYIAGRNAQVRALTRYLPHSTKHPRSAVRRTRMHRHPYILDFDSTISRFYRHTRTRTLTRSTQAPAPTPLVPPLAGWLVVRRYKCAVAPAPVRLCPCPPQPETHHHRYDAAIRNGHRGRDRRVFAAAGAHRPVRLYARCAPQCAHPPAGIVQRGDRRRGRDGSAVVVGHEGQQQQQATDVRAGA